MAFYGSPIIYQIDLIGSNSILATMVRLNPVTIIINSYRDVFLNHIMPDFQALGIVFVIALIVLMLGYMIFKKLEKGFAEQF